MLEQDSCLLQNQLNRFPVSGRLVLDEGVLSFTLEFPVAGAEIEAFVAAGA